MRIAVVGLGVIGAATARALALAGAEVTVFERSAPAAGTSGTSFAWINSHSKEPYPYHALNVAGMAEHRGLSAPPGVPCWLFATGNLEWTQDAVGTARLQESTSSLLARGYPVEWIGPQRAVELVPDLRVPAGVTEIAWYPEEGHVLPVALLARLWGEAAEHGAVLRCPVTVEGFTETRSGVRLATSDGSAEFDRVVLCAGRWSEGVAASAGIELPLADPDAAGSATVGLLGYTAPVAARLGVVLTTPTLNVRPDGGGRLVVQGLDLDGDADPAAPPPVDGAHARTLCARLTDLVAGTEGVRLESLRVGQRALPADGLTVAGFATERIYAIATHSGMTLGPLLGRIAAEEIVGGREDPLLADFRPGRFTGVDRTALTPLRPARFAGQQ